jgi:hypothetical protein
MIKNTLIFTCKALAVFGLLIALQHWIETKTHGFCLQKIQADDLKANLCWEISPLSPETSQTIDTLLLQPYSLIGAGSECFVFLSADQTTVLKLFKLEIARYIYIRKGLFSEDHRHLAGTLSDHPLTQIALPQPLNQVIKRILGIREFRIGQTFNSVTLAYNNLKEETGLLYLHLNPTHHFQKKLTLYDASGIGHQIDLDQTRFCLQKRAIPLEKHFTLLKKQNLRAKAQQSIDSLIQMIMSRCKKGFADRDLLNRNFGFIETQAIEIDCGSFLKNPQMTEPSVCKQEIFYATLELKEWFKKNYPEMVDYLEKKVSEQIDSNS